jgi:uncharacterized membrane protein required for colicin V production
MTITPQQGKNTAGDDPRRQSRLSAIAWGIAAAAAVGFGALLLVLAFRISDRQPRQILQFALSFLCFVLVAAYVLGLLLGWILRRISRKV